jgi:hypothetical protein
MKRVLRLTLLPPDIVEAILDGKQGQEVTLARVLEPFPLKWTELRQSCARSTRIAPTGQSPSSSLPQRSFPEADIAQKPQNRERHLSGTTASGTVLVLSPMILLVFS